MPHSDMMSSLRLSEPLVSVIVPSYNHRPYLQQRLDSIYSQHYRNFEVIVLDDASTDGSVEFLEQHKRQFGSSLHLNQRNSGSPFLQWKKGIDQAQGSYIWIAESDDACEPDFLDHLERALRLSDQIGFAYCQSRAIDEHGRSIGNAPDTLHSDTRTLSDSGVMRVLEGQDFIKKNAIYRNPIPNVSAVLFRADILKRSLEALEQFRFIGDWLLYLRLAVFTDVAALSLPLNLHRYHTSSVRKRSKTAEDFPFLFHEHARIFDFLFGQELIDAITWRSLIARNFKQLGFLLDLPQRLAPLTKDVNRLVIWGGGTIGEQVMECLVSEGIDKTRLLAIDKSLQRTNSSVFKGVDQITPNDYFSIMTDQDAVIVASIAFEDEILKELKKKNFSGHVVSFNS